MFTVALAGKKKLEFQGIYAVKDLHQLLLGGPALEASDLIKKNCVNAVNSEEQWRIQTGAMGSKKAMKTAHISSI